VIYEHGEYHILATVAVMNTLGSPA